MLRDPLLQELRASILLGYLAATVAGCSQGPQSSSNAKVTQANERMPAPAIPEKTPNTAGADGAQDTPVMMETDKDRYWLKQALRACRLQNFKSFFEAFVRSKAVQNQYTSDFITISTKGIEKIYPKFRYFDFPIGMTDYQYVSKNSEGAIGDKEFLALSFDQRPNNFYRVDWVRVHYAAIVDNAESEPEITEEYGLPGFLIFKPTNGCWQLAEDRVYGGPYQGNIRN